MVSIVSIDCVILVGFTFSRLENWMNVLRLSPGWCFPFLLIRRGLPEQALTVLVDTTHDDDDDDVYSHIRAVLRKMGGDVTVGMTTRKISTSNNSSWHSFVECAERALDDHGKVLCSSEA